MLLPPSLVPTPASPAASAHGAHDYDDSDSASWAGIIDASDLNHSAAQLPLHTAPPLIECGTNVGDVGFFLPAGAFFRLFNVLYPRDHPVNALTGVGEGGVPQGFEALKVGEGVLRKDEDSQWTAELQRPTFSNAGMSEGTSSSSQTTPSLAPSTPAPPLSRPASTTTTTTTSTATTTLARPAHTTLLPNHAITAYVRAHHASWAAFARARLATARGADKARGALPAELRAEDVVLVCATRGAGDADGGAMQDADGGAMRAHAASEPGPGEKKGKARWAPLLRVGGPLLCTARAAGANALHPCAPAAPAPAVAVLKLKARDTGAVPVPTATAPRVHVPRLQKARAGEGADALGVLLDYILASAPKATHALASTLTLRALHTPAERAASDVAPDARATAALLRAQRPRVYVDPSGVGMLESEWAAETYYHI